MNRPEPNQLNNLSRPFDCRPGSLKGQKGASLGRGGGLWGGGGLQSGRTRPPRVPRAANQAADRRIYLGRQAEADYREQLAALRNQLAKTERMPDERRVMEAIRVAQDFGIAWDKARPERATRCSACCSTQ